MVLDEEHQTVSTQITGIRNEQYKQFRIHILPEVNTQIPEDCDINKTFNLFHTLKLKFISKKEILQKIKMAILSNIQARTYV